jgi:hypothetical protein
MRYQNVNPPTEGLAGKHVLVPLFFGFAFDKLRQQRNYFTECLNMGRAVATAVYA